MIIFHVRKELGDLQLASGAVTGKKHADKISDLLEGIDDQDPGSRVVFDFGGVDLATASYLKASVLWAVTCGRMHAGIIDPDELRHLDATHFRPLNIFPLVADANAEIETEFQEVFGGRGLACVIANKWTPESILRGRVVGKLEPASARTIRAIKGLLEFTAYDLQDKHPKEGVNATAWNNRLAELHRLRLLRRRKDGKFWKYQPVADQLIYG